MSTRPLILLASLAVLSSCRSVGWEGEIKRWGSVVEVMRDGRTEGRVRLIDAAQGPEMVGLGVLEGLAGEISIVDGATWTSRVEPGGRVTTLRGSAQDARATFLVTSSVSDWVEIPIEVDMDLEQFVQLAGWSAGDWNSVPFVVKGKLEALRSHIVNGACPKSSAAVGAQAPARRDTEDVFGTLVGFWSRDTTGTLTHPGEALHVHAIVNSDGGGYTSHVESVRLSAGSIVRVPRQQQWVQRQRSSSRSR